MIRCIHLWTGDDQQSHFEERHIALDPGQRGDLVTGQRLLSGDEIGRRVRLAHCTGAPTRHHTERHAGFPNAGGPALPAASRRHPVCRGYEGLRP
jgi:hypothetical protein